MHKLRTLIRNSKKQLDKELCGCLLIVRRFWRRRRGLLSRQTSVLSFRKSFSDTYPSSATCAFGHWRWWSRWPTYSYKSKGSASSLNCHFFVDSIFFVVNVSWVWIYLPPPLIWYHSPNLNIAFRGRTLSSYVAGLETKHDVIWGDDCIQNKGLRG